MASLEPRTIIKNRDFYNHMIDFLTQTKNLFANSSSLSNPFYISRTNYDKLKSKLPNIPVYRTYFKDLLFSDVEIMDIKDEVFLNDEEKNALRQHIIQYYPNDLTPSHNTNNYNFNLFNDIYTRFRFFKIAYYKDIDNPDILIHYIESVEPTRSFVTGYGFFRGCGIAGTYTSELWSNAGYPSSVVTTNENKFGLVPILTQSHGGTLPDEFKGTKGQYNLGLLTNQNPDSRFILKKWIGGDDGKSVWYRYDVLANKLNSGNDSLKSYKSSFDSYISELAASQHKVIKADHANRLIAKSDELANSALHPFANCYYLLFSNLNIRKDIKARLVFHPASNTTYTGRGKTYNGTSDETNCTVVLVDVFSDWNTLARNSYRFEHYDYYFTSNQLPSNYEKKYSNVNEVARNAETEHFAGWTTYPNGNFAHNGNRTVQNNCVVGNSFVLLADYTNSEVSYHFYPVMYEVGALKIVDKTSNNSLDGVSNSRYTKNTGTPENITTSENDACYFYLGRRNLEIKYSTYTYSMRISQKSGDSSITYYVHKWVNSSNAEVNLNATFNATLNGTKTAKSSINVSKIKNDKIETYNDISHFYMTTISYRPKIRRKKTYPAGWQGTAKGGSNAWDALSDAQKQMVRDGVVYGVKGHTHAKVCRTWLKEHGNFRHEYNGHGLLDGSLDVVMHHSTAAQQTTKNCHNNSCIKDGKRCNVKAENSGRRTYQNNNTPITEAQMKRTYITDGGGDSGYGRSMDITEILVKPEPTITYHIL